MLLDVLFFVFSIAAFLVIVYILAMLWFSNTRSLQLSSFLGFGVATGLWIFFSAVAAIAAPEYFMMMYTVHTVTGCIFPYVFFWYALNFSESSLVHSKPLRYVLILLPVLDAIAFATNPWHKLMFLTYDYPNLPTGPLFWVHAIFAYIAFLGALITILRYVFRHARKTPMMLVAAASTIFPFVINVLLAFNLLGTRHDFTSVGFFVTFTLFFLTIYRSTPLSFKSLALANIFTSLSDVILIADEHGNVVDSNPAFRATFADFPLLEGQTTVSEFMQWLASRVTNYSPESMLAEAGDISTSLYNGEITLRVGGATSINDDETASERTFTVRRDFILQQNQMPSGFVITMSDVSAYRAMISEINLKNEHLVELKELAEEASRSKSTFLANMSHEIRTPINAITGMATIARGTDDLAKIHDSLDKVEAASRQLLGIINDILDMSKIEANRMELASEPFELPAVLRNVMSIMEINAAAKHHTLQVDIHTDVPRVVIGDDMRLSQILLNLLSNAVKFTPDHGKISLTAALLETREDMHVLEVKVQDNGIGMSQEQQQRLFQSFEQADASISKRFGGSGLGLVISKNLAELMDGGISLVSELGQGSCFTVRVCLRASDKDVVRRDEDMVEYDFNGCSVLLVEDIEINREIILEIMGSYGMHIDCAENGLQAVELFQGDPTRYKLILMDVQMPIMDGYTATRTIRASGVANAQSIPIVAMTANAFAEDIEHCREAGMNDHVAKPIEYEILLRKMARLLAESESG